MSTDRVNFLNVFLSDIHMQALEMHKKSPEKLRGWCIYWLVLATFTVFERITDAFLFFLPLYHEAKVAFVVYLWHPKSQGALYIYDKFVAPTLSKHEGLIDRKIEETQAKVGDVIFSYSKMAYAYVQKMTLQLLQSLPTAQAAMHAQQQTVLHQHQRQHGAATVAIAGSSRQVQIGPTHIQHLTQQMGALGLRQQHMVPPTQIHSHPQGMQMQFPTANAYGLQPTHSAPGYLR